FHESKPATTQTRPTTNAATVPQSVPQAVMPPSVPAGTSSNVVIRRAWVRNACPHSLETVSAAASLRAAVIAISNRGSPHHPYRTAHSPPTPMFASTCEALRPSLRSAVPIRCLPANPTRVATQVRANTVKRAANAPGPAPENKAKHTIAPATAPPRVTPRTAYPRRENAAVMTKIRPKRGALCAHHAAVIVVKPNGISCMADYQEVFQGSDGPDSNQ